MLLTGLAPAQVDFEERERIESSAAANFDAFGYSVDANAEWIVGGAPNANAVTVFRRDGLLEETRLEAPHALHQAFGREVLLAGNTLFVGDPQYDASRGRVDEYRFDGAEWQYHGFKVGAVSGDRFGHALGYEPSADMLLVGAPGRHGDGRAFVFALVSGRYELSQTLENVYAFDGDEYGFDLCADQGRLAVGQPGHLFGRGVVLSYQLQSGVWVEEDRLFHPDTTSDDWFGYAVDLEGERMAISAPFHDGAAVASGFVLVYRRDPTGWVDPITVEVSDASDHDYLGTEVLLHGDVLSVGAAHADLEKVDEGCVHQWRWRNDQWLPLQRLRDGEAAAPGFLGWALAADGDQFFAGAPTSESSGGPHAGAILCYELPDFAMGFEATANPPNVHVEMPFAGGDPGRPVALFVLDFDGAPFIQKIVQGSFDATGAWNLQGIIPPALFGHSLRLQAFSLNSDSKIEASNERLLQLF